MLVDFFFDELPDLLEVIGMALPIGVMLGVIPVALRKVIQSITLFTK